MFYRDFFISKFTLTTDHKAYMSGNTCQPAYNFDHYSPSINLNVHLKLMFPSICDAFNGNWQRFFILRKPVFSLFKECIRMRVPLKFLMTNFRISLCIDGLFVGNLFSELLLLLIAEKFGRLSPLSSTSIMNIKHLDLDVQ